MESARAKLEAWGATFAGDLMRLRGIGCAVALAALALPAAAPAYRIDRHVVPQPELRYYVGLSDWRGPFARVVKDLNAAHVGVRLVRASIPEQASIQIGRLEHKCGLPGVDGTTQTLRGGYAAIYLPRGCHGAIASIIAGHELGHALGLLHEDRRCALLNSSGGPGGVPTRCAGRRHNWLRHPFRADDLAGLRRLYRNTPPTALLRLADPTRPAVAGTEVRFTIQASDRERNLSELRIDFGDGTGATAFTAAELPHTHAYSAPGTYKAKLSVVDYYLRRASSSVTVNVAAGR
jgi:hypothetical protein